MAGKVVVWLNRQFDSYKRTADKQGLVIKFIALFITLAIISSVRGTVRKMRIYNDKEFSILKSPTSPLINREIGLFHYP